MSSDGPHSTRTSPPFSPPLVSMCHQGPSVSWPTAWKKSSAETPLKPALGRPGSLGAWEHRGADRMWERTSMIEGFEGAPGAAPDRYGHAVGARDLPGHHVRASDFGRGEEHFFEACTRQAPEQH